MGSVDRIEDRSFRADFTGDGVDKLREKVRDKLKEFMGDYTDDTLVEYVIVLLRNGRRKEEARNELHVFLGDDSDSFVAWLWDHLASNLDLYVQPQDASDIVKTKSIRGDQDERNESHHNDSEAGKEKPDNLPRSRHKREWKAMTRDATEPPPLRSSVVDNMHVEERHDRRGSHARRSSSPQPPQHKKRSRQDERQQLKRDAVSHATINAPRRLLQSAVRDAVGTLRPSDLLKDPSVKRLRSVVSASTIESSLLDRPRRIQSVARVPNPMATVIKAVQAAAADVVKVKSSRNVFDRLGRKMDISETSEQIGDFRDDVVEDEFDVYEEFNQNSNQTQQTYPQRHDYAGRGRNIGFLDNETGMAAEPMSDDEVYDNVDVMGDRIMDFSETGTSGGNKREDLLNLHYNDSKRADDMHITQNKNSDQPLSAAKAAVNVSMNLNTWRPPQYQESRGIMKMGNWNSVQENEADTTKSVAQVMKENNHPVTVSNGNAKPVADIQKDSQKTLISVPGSYTTGRPLEDADSRTIFVSNVHFAATKDSLSRHFNKFGDVLKVVILTDAATGQPKGSAYVEFMRKEAADNALSFDGASFMSRILKVVKRSPANQEATTNMTWPRVTRATPFTPGRFSRAHFPRGIPGAFRPRFTMKPGARSFQWKRDAPAESAAPVSGSLASPTARSLTYVRTEPKPDGNSALT
ncbi:uncharacterized protein LOC126660670 [Mercurialis annua]|uniref:uncharacterized protein LOC126660670 n=1 Tax=Mercurialis annua TaxID=3986 RepID=UPI002160AD7E|nr:uncharacterized protein LOC126660670 [Mercurialis annua]